MKNEWIQWYGGQIPEKGTILWWFKADGTTWYQYQIEEPLFAAYRKDTEKLCRDYRRGNLIDEIILWVSIAGLIGFLAYVYWG